MSTSLAITEFAMQADVARAKSVERLNRRGWEFDFTQPLIHLSAKQYRDLIHR
jgi:hypothetical protein